MASKFALLCLGLIFAETCFGVLEDKVSYYEVLGSEEISTRSRRSASALDQHTTHHEMTLRIFNMTLVCHLHPENNFFAPTFRLVVIDGNKKNLINNFDRDQFLTGTCEGDDASDVHGYFTEGRFEGSITFRGVVYGIESAKRHMEEEKPGELHGKMIAYRSSDMLWEANQRGKGPTFCGASHVDGQHNSHLHPGGTSHHSHPSHSAEAPSRRKRAPAQPHFWSTCRMIAVADYKFYRFIGDRDIYNTAAYIASVMATVNSIYRGTVFNVGYDITGMGFEIAEMQINVNPTSGYNTDRADWETLELLQTFGRDRYFEKFCVAHLFTHQQFSGNVLGLAYIASQDVGSAGGICSPTREMGNYTTSLNTGWSTTLNSNKDTVLAQQAQLVTAHELGHNWGAEHDPDTDECSPSSVFGSGKYLMYAYSVNGYDSNNNVFSPCSKRDIGAVLASKAEACFSKTPDENKLCGNGKVDGEEECDAGYLGQFNLDPCCSSECLLIGSATCSPVNHECCQNCFVAPLGTVCRADTDISCVNASYCDGQSLSCPPAPNKDKGSSCLDMGKCDGNGICDAFCEARNKFSCTCDIEAESCQRCCRDNSTAECKPYDNNHPLPNSRPCVVGYCTNGVCVKSENSAIQRLFDILDKLSIDGILEFFRNNLVGCIMVFSLILWIPLSCCISYKDRKLRRSLKKEAFVDLREDRDFLCDEDGRRVSRPDGPGTSTPRTPRGPAPRRLPPIMSPRNKELVQHRNRVMPISPLAGADPN
ncbi:ADAM 17-like protease [Babylonia areolata]|uniref:ADAM 17-like protease n=1 Tax=Babylonia areolata TaxID=304850 RepID=UPI003FD04759